MLRPRIIPCLLIHQGGLFKTKGFSHPKYVGDPINAVKIFNEKEADELLVLDIDATVEGREPDYSLIERLAAECRMPLCYGGGVKTVAQAEKIIRTGVEKVSLSAAAVTSPESVYSISSAFGRQSVVAVIDVRKKSGLFARGYEVCTHNGKYAHTIAPVELAENLQEAGAGEIVINSVDNDGMMGGYDLDLANQIKSVAKVPLTVLGGAGSHVDIKELFAACGIIGAAAGSLFVFKGKYRAVLINYPNSKQKDEILS